MISKEKTQASTIPMDTAFRSTMGSDAILYRFRGKAVSETKTRTEENPHDRESERVEGEKKDHHGN